MLASGFNCSQTLCALLIVDLLPEIQSEGSVGASDGLTPLSYLAAVLCGKRNVFRNGLHIPARNVMQDANINSIGLRPNEALALVNGTAAMTGLACLTHPRSQCLRRLSTRITAFCTFALDGNVEYFDERLFAAKPHAGMQKDAESIRFDRG